MDTLTGLLDGPRARGAFLLRSILDPPWCLRIQDEAPLSLVTLVRGDAWIRPDGGGSTRLLPGDVALLRGSDPYTIADDPGTDRPDLARDAIFLSTLACVPVLLAIAVLFTLCRHATPGP